MVAMAGGGVGPKILLAKPAAPRIDGGLKLMREREDDGTARARLPHGSLNLLSDAWEFVLERSMSLVSDNTDFTVIGVLGAPGVGKSTIMNQLYGFDATAPASVLPPFAVQSEENQATARHCSMGMELRVSAERLILLDTQPLFSASVLTDLMRPDGSSAVPVLPGEVVSGEQALELMSLQLGMFLCSVCHVVLLVTEGLQDVRLLRLMQTVEMLKQGIPDPSLPAGAVEPESADGTLDESADYFADTIFVHSKLRDEEVSLPELQRLERTLCKLFSLPAFRKNGAVSYIAPHFPASSHGRHSKAAVQDDNMLIAGRPVPAGGVNFFVLPLKGVEDCTRRQYESFSSMMWQLRDRVLSMPRRPFAKIMSERDWLRNAARIWDLVKKSPVLADYSKMLQGSGLYRR